MTAGCCCVALLTLIPHSPSLAWAENHRTAQHNAMPPRGWGNDRKEDRNSRYPWPKNDTEALKCGFKEHLDSRSWLKQSLSIQKTYIILTQRAEIHINLVERTKADMEMD